MTSDARSDIARLSAVVDHQGQAIEQLESAGRETASIAAEHGARIRNNEALLKRHEELISGGKDSLTVRMGMIEGLVEQLLVEIREARDQIADLDRRKVSGDLPHADAQPSDLARVKLAEEDTKKTLIKLLLAGGTGGGLVAAAAKLWEIAKAWLSGGGHN